MISIFSNCYNQTACISSTYDRILPLHYITLHYHQSINKNSNLQLYNSNPSSPMLQQLKALEQYLIHNKMSQTLKSLRSQMLSKYPQAPSQQFIELFESSEQQNQARKNRKSMELTQNNMKKIKVQDKMKNEKIVEGLLSKIAYSSKLLENQEINCKINRLLGNRIFEKAMTNIFPETAHKFNDNIQYVESEVEFKDELDMIQFGVMPLDKDYKNPHSVMQPSNLFSQIHAEHEESSLISQPSLVLSELNKNQFHEEYMDDKDKGYYEFIFNQSQLINGCSKLTQKYGYPEKALLKNTKNQPYRKMYGNKAHNNKDHKFSEGITFPNSNDPIYPRQYNNIIYDVLKLKVIFDREKTGYEQHQQIQISQGDILAGRYRVQTILGSGVFAKVLRVFDLIKKQHTCLKMVSNNKDFFDQALDQIKILRYINANCNPDQHNLLKFKGAFYHREHLFIQTDLLKQNLFMAYSNSPSLFSISVLKKIAKQILQALSMLHSLHIIHADLKPQNILIKQYKPSIKIKVVDLGNSCFFHDHLGQYVQSRSYRAPEVVLGNGYDEKIDVWSVGCILAELWTKNVLFYNENIQGMLARIQGIVGPWPEWMLDKGNAVQNYFSKQNLIFFEKENKFHILIPKNTTLRARIRSDDEKFLNFLEMLLKIDPNQRMSTQEALQHPFLRS